MSVILELAWRHLASQPRQAALTVAGVGLGVAVFVFTVSMMDGLVVFFTQRQISVSPLLTVLPEKLDGVSARASLHRAAADEVVSMSRAPLPDERPTIRGAPALADRVRGVPGVVSVSLQAATPAVLAFGTVAEPVSLVGVEPDREAMVTELPRSVVRGSWAELAWRRDGAVLGVELARRLGADLGDRLVVSGETGQARELEVVGVLASGLGSFDEACAFVPLPVAQGLAGWGADEASEIRVRTTGLEGLGGMRQRLAAVTGYRTQTWDEASRSSLQLFRMIGVTTYLLTGFVLVVAGLGIANKLTTIILDKERDIAILRSFGFGRGTVRAVFVTEGLLLGGAGAAFGCLAALTTIVYFTVFPITFGRSDGAVVAYTKLYLVNDPRYYAIIAAAALVIAALAALLAVRRAVRVPPVEVLRGAA